METKGRINVFVAKSRIHYFWLGKCDKSLYSPFHVPNGAVLQVAAMQPITFECSVSFHLNVVFVACIPSAANNSAEIVFLYHSSMLCCL